MDRKVNVNYLSFSVNQTSAPTNFAIGAYRNGEG